MNILVSGSLAYDQIMTYPGEFKDHILINESSDLNVSFLVDQMSKQFGGTAGNIAYSLSLLGQQSTVIASLGKDYSQYLEWLDTKGIQTTTITVNQSTYTATAYISTDIKGNQIAFFYPGLSCSSWTTPWVHVCGGVSGCVCDVFVCVYTNIV